jgi:hypothetical protein
MENGHGGGLQLTGLQTTQVHTSPLLLSEAVAGRRTTTSISFERNGTEIVYKKKTEIV